MHTKKTNNTNKLIQISYHSILTKIQKLQNFKKKKKHFSVSTGTLGIGRYYPKLAGTAGIFFGSKQGGRMYRIAGRYGTELTTLHRTTQEQKKTSDEVYIWQKKFSKLQATYDCQKNKTQIYTCSFLYLLFSFNNTFCLLYKYKYIYIEHLFLEFQ